MRFSVSSPLSLSLVHFCVFLALVATFCQAAPMFKYQSFAAVADEAALDAADYARRVGSFRGPLGVVSPPHQASSSAPRLGLFTEIDETTGKPLLRVQDSHIPPARTANSHQYNRFGKPVARIYQQSTGVRLTNNGDHARIFHFRGSPRAYYVAGRGKMTVPYGTLTSDQIKETLIHKVPKGTKVEMPDPEINLWGR
ncbi:conserved hypothetical protein [Sporisorium reilianum SRZ2]|uniref:Uncharacterized protein n=1 Tax=Sporisorium reilianum (strain SRZ2) TaxID=999809 RepID=E6ZUF6_SPORE|nr:conserved hypothetical protein [Sporisorium reilianum SRZ2]